LRTAIDQYHAQGGPEARLARYRENCAALVSGMRALGLRTFLPDAVQAPIIVTFHAPPDPAYAFAQFYQQVRQRGFILYPGKLTAVDTFRVGCIGAIGADTLRRAVAAVGEVLREMGVHRTAA
jgi:2-aminoethylphosphonate-pyruvate transaminase